MRLGWQRLSKTSARGWLWIGQYTFGWEAGVWSRRLGVTIDRSVEHLTFGFKFPPVFVYLVLPSWRRLPYGEFQLSVHDWAIWFTPWGRAWERRKTDPWWKRGLTIRIDDLFLGRTDVKKELVREGIPVEIPMPEGIYCGTAKVERYTYKRPRWFTRKRLSTWIEVPRGIPHSGKGENSWDCGDDGVWATGCEGDDVPKAIQTFREVVLKNREKYGHASKAAVQEALAACM